MGLLGVKNQSVGMVVLFLGSRGECVSWTFPAFRAALFGLWSPLPSFLFQYWGLNSGIQVFFSSLLI
jgi:hypothetical protein